MSKFLESIFSVKNVNSHKVVNIFGFKLKFKNKTNLIQLQILKIIELCSCLKDMQQSIYSKFNELFSAQQSQFEQLTKLDQISAASQIVQNNYNKSLYLIPGEIAHLQQFPAYYEREDFFLKYKNLVRGLDDESILNINKIITYQKKCKDCGNIPIDIFSDKEKAYIENLKATFNNLIVQLGKDVFAYKKYLLPINWFEECVFYYKHGIPVLRNAEYFKDKDIIDAGAFIGDSALVLSDYTSKNVYSFEMLPEHIELINKTIELNNLTNVIPVNKALGDECKKVKFNINTSSTSIKDFSHSPILGTSEVEMITLDEFVNVHNLEVGLIKTDLEGAEQEFLRGAENTIKTQKPTLLISIYHSPSDLFEIKPMIESWNLGYKFKIIKQTEKVHLETMLLAEI